MSFERIRHRRVGAYGVLRDVDRRTLLTAVPNRAGDLRWGLPGGVLGHGESPEAALSREVSGMLADQASALRLHDVVADVIEPPGSRALVHTVRLVHHAKARSRDEPPWRPGAGHRLVPDAELVDLPLLYFAASALGVPASGLVEDIAPGAAPSFGNGPVRVQRTAAYAVLIADRRILLAQLSQSGRWTLPGGGIEFGEQPAAALRREVVLEETELASDQERLVGVGGMHATPRSPAGRLEDFHAVRIYFRGEVSLDVEPVVQEVGGSTDAVAWAPVRDLDRIPLAGTVQEGMAPVRPDLVPHDPTPRGSM